MSRLTSLLAPCNMESLNLNTLASSLPTANLQNAEKDLLNNFKAAALSITTLYRSSRRTSKRAYNAGYGAACHDLLMMIQQGVSVGGISNSSSSSHDPEDGGVTIGKVMDWIEARLEAIKSREEEEDEDEEKEKEKERHRNTPTLNQSDPKIVKPSTPSQSHVSTTPCPPPQRKDQVAPSLPTPSSSDINVSTNRPSQPSSPSPPPPTALRSIYPPNPPHRYKSRLVATDAKHSASDRQLSHPHSNSTPTTPNPSSTHFTFTPSTVPMSQIPNTLPSLPATDLATGAKRRHAVMMMLDSSFPVSASSPSGTSRSHSPLQTANNSPSTHIPGATRRRTRSSRGLQSQHLQNLNVIQATEAMDVEEDGGRERKRVTRRLGQ